MLDFWKNFFRLTRPLSNVKNIAIISLAFYLSKTPLNWGLFILGALSLSLIFSAIYSYNTICDADLDKKNIHKKHYSASIKYFGREKALLITVILLILGLLAGIFLNIYFFVTLVLLLLTGFFYSSKYFRFKEIIGLDVLFGASLTFLFRFIASWFIFSISFPSLLAMFGLVFLKNGGYMLYKGYDRQFLADAKIKNSITYFSQKTTLIISAIFFALSICFFILLCLSGSLPIVFLFLLVLFIPPIVIQYLLFLDLIKINARYIRAVGFTVLLILILVVLLVLK